MDIYSNIDAHISFFIAMFYDCNYIQIFVLPSVYLFRSKWITTFQISVFIKFYFFRKIWKCMQMTHRIHIFNTKMSPVQFFVYLWLKTLFLIEHKKTWLAGLDFIQSHNVKWISGLFYFMVGQ